MNIFAKISVTTLPLVLFFLAATVGITYYFSHNALTHLAETWLETRLDEAMKIASEQKEILYRYGLESVPASNAKAKLDAAKAISAIEVGQVGYIFAVDTRGVITMHPDELAIGIDVSEQEWFQKMAHGEKGQLRLESRNVDNLAIYDFFEPWQWFLLAVDPIEEVYGEAERMKPYLIYIGVLSSLLLATVLMLLTRRLTGPLRELSAGVKRIGQGELSTRTAIRSKDEVGLLSKVFNEMAAKVEESHHELERRVTERTNELNQTNLRLRHEVEERTKAQEALRTNEQKLKAILSASPIGIGLIVDRKLDWANDMMYHVVGYERGSLINANTEIIYPTRAEYERVGEVIAKGIAEGRVGQTETTMHRKDGTTIDCLVRACPLDPDHPYAGLIVTLTDISGVKRLEAQLQRAKKMEAIGTLAGGVAHDLNNILSGIVSYPELLLLELPEDSPFIKPINTIKKTGEMAAAVVQDLLTMARRGVAVTEVLNLNEIITEQMKSLEYENLTALHTKVEFSIHLDPDLMNVEGSAVHLSKSIMNLITNAAEAMPTGGTIDVATQNSYIDKPIRGYEEISPGDYVAISVADTGTGLSRTDMERIFEPFYTRKKMGRSGSGLGMAVVWGTVKDHNGYIDIQSKKNEGSTFTIFFPATHQSVQGQVASSSMDRYLGGGETIMVVDDSDVQREIARSILEKLGYAVSAVPSGEDAIEALKTRSVDLIVLDMNMEPGMDGLDTYKEIIRRQPDQKVIIASGFAESARVKDAQRLGAGRYIKKPYTIERIGTAVKDAMGE